MTQAQMIAELKIMERLAEIEIAKAEDDIRVMNVQYILDLVRERIENWEVYGRSHVCQNQECQHDLGPEQYRHAEFMSTARTYFI